MKKLWLISTLSLGLILLAGCTNNTINNEDGISNNVEESDISLNVNEGEEQNEIEEAVEEEIIDGQRWILMAFNGKEVDGNYRMIIKDDKDISVKFCNGIGGTVSFDGDDEGTISASLVQTEMACEGESMDLENAFKIDGAAYSTMPDEDGGATMIIMTTNGDKFYWRAIMD